MQYFLRKLKKTFENWLTFDEVMMKRLRVCVYGSQCSSYLWPSGNS